MAGGSTPYNSMVADIEGYVDSLEDTIGAVDTATATGAVTDTDLMMAYVKQLVTAMLTVATDVAGIDGDAMKGTDDAALASVLGALDTATATGDVTDSDLTMAYLKQLVTQQNRALHFMSFWSDLDASLAVNATAADANLPDIVVADLPSGATITRAIMLFKYASREDSSGSANMTDAAQTMSIDAAAGRDSVVTAINLPTDSFATAASTKEGGDVVFGDNDVSAEVTGNGTYYSTWELADVDGASLTFTDVQIGLLIWYSL